MSVARDNSGTPYGAPSEMGLIRESVIWVKYVAGLVTKAMLTDGNYRPVILLLL